MNDKAKGAMAQEQLATEIGRQHLDLDAMTGPSFFRVERVNSQASRFPVSQGILILGTLAQEIRVWLWSPFF